MKKRGISIIALVVVMTMAIASLTGCGTQAKATDVQISEENMDETTIIVTESDTTETTSESTIVSSENDNNEVTSTEVIGGTEEKVFAGAENDDIVLNAEKGEKEYLELDYETFESFDATFTAREEIPLISGNGEEVGYIKVGGNVTVTGAMAGGYDWARFENPIEGTDYEYLYLMKSCIPNPDAVYPTVEDVTARIEELMYRRAFDAPTILDTPTEDMEVHEFVIAKEYESKLDFEKAVTQGVTDSSTNDVLFYMTYYVECQEEKNVIRCKIYYKDEHEIDPY